jgi:hypothetical protein
MDRLFSIFTRSDVRDILNQPPKIGTCRAVLSTGILCTMTYIFWLILSLNLMSLSSTLIILTFPGAFIALGAFEGYILQYLVGFRKWARTEKSNTFPLDAGFEVDF